MTPVASATAPADLQPPPQSFNFAQHLLAANAQRPAKLAFVDELGSVSYGALDERVRRVAAGLRGLGIKREEQTRLVALRDDIERQARAQFTEGAITGAEYVETRTDVVEANLTLQRHRAELAQAEARYLTTLGLAPRSLQP